MSTAIPGSAQARVLPDLERQVLELIAEGHEVQEVVARLGLSGVRQVHHRIRVIGNRFGLERAIQPQLVDHAYTHGVLPAPTVLEPLVLTAEEYGLVRALAAGGTIGTYGRTVNRGPSQATRLVTQTRAKLEATTLASLIRRSWQRQILGPTVFAADLARMHGRREPPRDIRRWVIVPLRSGHRLAGPADDVVPARHLDITDLEEALAAARFLSARDGFAPLWIADPQHPRAPYRVGWGQRRAAARQGLAPGPARPASPVRSRTA